MSSYLNGFFKSPQQIVDTIVHELFNPLLGQVDAIVGRGVSGILPLMSVSIRTGIPAYVVRKPGNGAHSTRRVEGSGYLAGRYVIIDDQIDSGTTVRTILNTLKDRECAGIILYNGFADNKYNEFSEYDGLGRFPFESTGWESTPMNNSNGIPVINVRKDIDQLISIHRLSKP